MKLMTKYKQEVVEPVISTELLAKICKKLKL